MNTESTKRLELLHPTLRLRWQQVDAQMTALGMPVIVSEGLRDWQTQERYYAKGRTIMSDVACVHNNIARKPGTCAIHPLGATVTNAPPGWSWHQFALAIDAEPDNPQQAGLQPDWNPNHAAWGRLLVVAGAAGLSNGGHWRTRPDLPHFWPRELPDTPPDTVRECYRCNGFEAAWRMIARMLPPLPPGVTLPKPAGEKNT